MMQYRSWGGRHDRIHIHPTASGPEDIFLNACSGNITIGPHAFWGHEVMILAAQHDYSKFGQARKEAVPSDGHDIVIEEGAWIASRAMIMGPCHIGKHAVIGAGSVVTKDVAEYTVVAGNPAKFIKNVPR